MEKEVYDQFFRAEEVHWWFRARRRVIRSLLNDLLPPKKLAIADVGCGTGGMLSLLAGYGEVTGVDEAPEAREYCRRRGFDRILTPTEWQAVPERYDLVTAFDVVEHVADDAGFLRSMAERLAPGGHLVVTVPAYMFLWSTFDEMNHHQRRYNRKTLRAAFAAAGLTLSRLTHFNAFLLPPMVVVRLAEKLLKSDPTDPQAKQEALERWFRVGPLNGALEGVFAAERHWLARADFPAGSSIFAVAQPEAAR